MRLGDGFAAAWYDTRDGNAEIYLRLLDADGRPAGPERRLTNGPEDSYEVSIDGLGDAIAVAWYDQSGKGQQVTKLGLWNTGGSNRWVKTMAEGTRNPVIQSDGRAIFCAWIQMELDGREAVFGGWWEADGQPRAAPLRLGPASKTTWNLNVALDHSGVPWVVFDAAASTRTNELYVVRADAAGTGAVRLTKDDGASSKYPDLAIGADGRAALTWYDERDGNAEVYLLTGRLADLTGEIDGRSRRVTTTPGESIGAYLDWNGDRLGLAWSDKIGGQHEIVFQSFDTSGTARGPARRLTQNTTWSLVPAIQPWRGGFALAWNEYAPASVEIHVGTSEVFFVSVP
ncbi:MAG TPA: hypothetical protein VI485_17600 [Vicinamibacterales bacterium]|nr:hypothetical protein [Vicinamibacterales bacterium]